MTEKMEKQTVQKLFDYMKTNQSNQRPYPPLSPYESYYPHIMHPQSNPYQEPTFPSENDKSKIPYPYNEYFKHNPYYQNYGIPKPNNQIGDPSSHNSTNLNSRLTLSNHQQHNQTNSQNSMYSMGMQHGNPYSYGYPYYGYHGMPYPYSMYPPYYYNRSMSDMYGTQPSPNPPNPNSYMGSQNQMIAPPLPYYNHPSYPPQRQTNSIVKQQIVISSDEERGRNENYWNNEENDQCQKQGKEIQKKEIQKKLDLSEQVPKPHITENNLIKQKKIEINKVVSQNKQENKKNDQELLHPFVIKRKRISKEEKQAKATRKKQKQFQGKDKGQKKKKKSIINGSAVQQQKQEKQEKQYKQQKQHNKLEGNSFSKQKQSVVSSRHIEQKQNVASQKLQTKKQNKSKGESLIQPPSIMSNQKEDKKMPHEQCSQDKQNLKKDKVKDDHPLKQLRYSESHGRIRIGNYFQSVIPDILHGDSILILRKQLQRKLEQRQISAITF